MSTKDNIDKRTLEKLADKGEIPKSWMRKFKKFTTESNRNYDDVWTNMMKGRFSFLFINTHKSWKSELLKMAITSIDRPKDIWKSRLSRFVSRTSKYNDIQFTRDMYVINRHWTPNDFDGTNYTKKLSKIEKMQLLMDMARNGDPKPKKGDDLFYAFRSYITKNGKMFDSSFTKSIHTLNPNWETNSISNIDYIALLLKMAVNNEPRPSSKTNIGTYLGCLINKKNRYRYNYNFHVELESVAPSDWKISPPESVAPLPEEYIAPEPTPTISDGYDKTIKIKLNIWVDLADTVKSIILDNLETETSVNIIVEMPSK